MRSITRVLLDGEDEGPCKKPRFFKKDGDQYAHMSRFDGITEKNAAREAFAQRMMREAKLNKVRPKEA